jgi:hypothetical protein
MHKKQLADVPKQALTFDVRRGAHSIGSNVRDAAAYLIWSLARSGSPDDIRPFATDIAVKLAAVACYDREVTIRRAASAAFQEHVGRMVSCAQPMWWLDVNQRLSAGLVPSWHRRLKEDGLLLRQCTQDCFPRRSSPGRRVGSWATLHHVIC